MLAPESLAAATAEAKFNLLCIPTNRVLLKENSSLFPFKTKCLVVTNYSLMFKGISRL